MDATITARGQWALLLVLSLLATLLPIAVSGGGSPASAAGIDGVCHGAPRAHFADAEVVSPPFVDAVDCLAAYGITQGDAQGAFRPGATVTRQHMALFLVRFLAQARSGDLEAPDRPGDGGAFEDLDELSPEVRDAANLLADLGIARGIGDGAQFAPAQRVTRAQMASFVVRTLLALDTQLPLVTDEVFPDVPAGSIHAAPIGALAGMGVVRGYPDGRYGPADPVTREQIAAFLLRSAEVLDGQGQWQGQFLAVDPPPAPEPETPGEVDTAPQTPTEPTPPPPSMVLGIDGNERVVGATLQVTVRLLGASGSPLDEVGVTWALYARDDFDALPPGVEDPAAVHLDLARALSSGPAIDAGGAARTDADGQAALRIPTAHLPVGRHLVVVWAGPAGLEPLEGALAFETLPIELFAPAEEQATFLATATLATDGAEGPHLLLSDAVAVTARPAGDDATYRIEGIPVSERRFLEQARVGDRVRYASDDSGREFRLSRADPRREGIVEVREGVRFIDPASGVALSEDLDELLTGQLYEVDGEPVGERRFRQHLSTGDYLRIEIVEEESGTQPALIRHRLEDRAVRGELVALVDDVAVLDPNPDDDWPVGPGGLGDGLRVDVAASVPDEPESDTTTFLVDDADPTDLTRFVAALEAVLAPWGGRATLEMDRRAGGVIYHLTTTPPEPFTQTRGIVLDGDLSGARDEPPGSWTIDLAVGGGRERLHLVAEPRAIIDGLLATAEDLLDTVSIGDRLTCLGANRQGTCTQVRLVRESLQARLVYVDDVEQEVDLLLDGGYVMQRVDLRERAFGVRGGPVRFRIEEQDFDGTLAALLAEVARVDLDVHEVRVRLEDGGVEGPAVWVIEGLTTPAGETD